MEFPNLGKRCAWSLCKTLDFLPLTCSYCNQIFCKDHFNQDIHECEAYKKELNKQTDIKSFVCSIEDCTTCSPVEMLCQKCQKHFCLVHRYHDCFDVVDDIENKRKMWNKPREQFAESLKNVNTTINEKIEKAVQDPRKQATALKIQLMRLKGKAIGMPSIPSTDRVYFLILPPKNSNKEAKPIFVSRDWSVGKVIDSVVNILDVINKNNEMQAPKLRLFKAINGRPISKETSVKIIDLINENILSSGESLILEYVDSTEDLESFVLSDFGSYKSCL